ncbi:UNVERIFIED_CONTAM: hypothetical protein HDU68_004098 [Siphonaria sp. JEL0065]|nr:hypothetical protein HDU68_004098 [Siphonaria sp. JEL0065]
MATNNNQKRVVSPSAQQSMSLQVAETRAVEAETHAAEAEKRAQIAEKEVESLRLQLMQPVPGATWVDPNAKKRGNHSFATAATSAIPAHFNNTAPTTATRESYPTNLLRLPTFKTIAATKRSETRNIQQQPPTADKFSSVDRMLGIKAGELIPETQQQQPTRELREKVVYKSFLMITPLTNAKKVVHPIRDAKSWMYAKGMPRTIRHISFLGKGMTKKAAARLTKSNESISLQDYLAQTTIEGKNFESALELWTRNARFQASKARDSATRQADRRVPAHNDRYIAPDQYQQTAAPSADATTINQ